MVEPEGIAQAGHVAALLVLLPVEPPEIDALPLQRMDDAVEVGVRPGLLVKAVWNGRMVARLGGSAIDRLSALVYEALRPVVIVRTGDVIGHEGRIDFFPRDNADGGMQVQRGLKAHIVHFPKEALRITDQVTVPGVAGPTDSLPQVVFCTTSGARPGLMPVHVDHHDVDGNLPLAEFPPQRQKFIVGVGPVTAPPVAEGIFGRHRNASCHLRIGLQRGLVVVAVSKKIKILHLPRFASLHPLSPVAVIVYEQVSSALVHHGPAVPREDAQFHRIRIVEMVWA